MLRQMMSDEVLNLLFYVDESSIHGRGLHAAVDIQEGDYIGEYDGPVVTENDMHVLWAENEEGEWIARDGKNILRYLNHDSSNPHAAFHGFRLYALRDIKQGEEIMIDYGEDPQPDFEPGDRSEDHSDIQPDIR